MLLPIAHQQAIMHQASSSNYPIVEHAGARATLRQVCMLEDCLEVMVCDLHVSLHASASVLLARPMLPRTLSTSCMQLCETLMPMAIRTLERTSLKSVIFRTLKARMRNFPSNSLRAPYTLTYTPSRHSLIFCIVCTRSRQSTTHILTVLLQHLQEGQAGVTRIAQSLAWHMCMRR